jgi:hypothetical protein
MIDRQDIKAKAAAAREPKPKAPAPQQPPGEIAAGVGDLVAELGANPAGDAWVSRLEERFRHLLHRRLQQARFHLQVRSDRPLPRGRIDEIRDLVAIFLRETSRLMDELAPQCPIRPSLGPWLHWIEGQFIEEGLGDLWAEIRPQFSAQGLENV